MGSLYPDPPFRRYSQAMDAPSTSGAPRADDDRSGGLLAWQRALYPGNHTTRRNLVLHVLTVPLFLAGTVDLVGAVARLSPLQALFGVGAMALAVVAQGRGHRAEPVVPVPFRGPADAVARLFVEQWVTFPRFVLSGGFARAWRVAR